MTLSVVSSSIISYSDFPREGILSVFSLSGILSLIVCRCLAVWPGAGSIGAGPVVGPGRQHSSQADDQPGIQAELVNIGVSGNTASRSIITIIEASFRGIDGSQQLGFQLQ